MVVVDFESQALVSGYPELPLDAGALEIDWEAANVTGGGNTFTGADGDMLLMWNTDDSAHTVDIASVADDQKRVGDIENYSVPAGQIHGFRFTKTKYWANASTHKITVTGDDDTLMFAVIH